MKVTNDHNLPSPVVRALSRNDYDSGNTHLSVTQLIDSPRVQALRRKHWDEITEDVSDKLWSVLGTAVHRVFEENVEEDVISEERLFLDVNDWTVSGAIDLQDKEGPVDYKCTSVWSVIFEKKEWALQLNCYAWLMRHAKARTSTKLKIVAVMRDWNRREAQRNPDYPQAPIQIVDVPKWTDEEQDQYVAERVKLHQDAQIAEAMGERLPLCTDEERWRKKSSYAVRKPTNKKATRVFDELSLAEKYVEDNSEIKYVIDERVGEYTRCKQNWCRVAEFCDQYEETE